jgi:hypothetical protein
MRVFVLASVAAVSALTACGGGTPPAKDSDEAVAATPKPAEHAASDDSSPAAANGAGGDPMAGSSATGSTAAQPPSSTPSLDTAAAGGDDPWMASHQMTPKDVLAGTRPVKGKAQACFHAGEKRDPSTSGEVKIRFVITNAGAVRVWRDEGSSMSDAEVTQCIGDVLKGVKFPKQKSPGDAWGVYSVNFGN